MPPPNDRQLRGSADWRVVSRSLTILWVFLGPILNSQLARAEPESYDSLIDVAVSEHEAGRFVEARELFLRAHALQPSARTHRALGKVEFELRNYGEAVFHLRAALDATVKPLDPALRAEAERLLERAEAYVGEVHVEVQPDTATVVLDGVTVASGPSASLTLVVGDHVLEFRAFGMHTERRAIRVAGGARSHVQVVLSPFPGVKQTELAPDQRVSAHPATQAGPSATHDSEALLRKRRWVWAAAAGVVVVAAAVGIGFALRGESDAVEAPAYRTATTPDGVLIQALGAR